MAGWLPSPWPPAAAFQAATAVVTLAGLALTIVEVRPVPAAPAHPAGDDPAGRKLPAFCPGDPTRRVGAPVDIPASVSATCRW
jgi:hypothetical protein